MTALLARVTALVAAAALVAACARRRSAAERHWVWTLALAGAVGLAPLALVGARWRVVPWPAAVRPPRVIAAQAGSKTLAPVVIPAQAGSQTLTTSLAPRLRGDDAHGAGTRAAHAAAPRRTPSLPDALPLAWAAGTALLLLRLAGAHRRARRLVRAAAPCDAGAATGLAELRALDVRVSREARVPFAYGLRRAVVVLPAEAGAWDAARLRARCRTSPVRRR